MKKVINKYKTFLKYFFSSGVSFIIDLTLFTIFNLFFKQFNEYTSIIISTIFARIISSLINYYLNRNKVFEKNDNKQMDKITLLKYYLLVVVQMLISSYAVTIVYQITKFNETLIKVPIECILFIINFFVQKYFIFNREQFSINIKKGKIYLFIMSILTSWALVYKPIITDFIVKIDFRTNSMINIILVLFLYKYYQKYYLNTERRTSFKVVSVIFTILLVLGYSYEKVDSGMLVFSNIQYIVLSIVKVIGYYNLINLSLNLLYEYIEKLNIKEKKFNNKYISLFFNKPFKVSFIAIFAVYMIYLIAYYPGVVGYDPSYQIKEVMGMQNFYSESINLVDPNVMITAFNPVLHTLLVGGLFKLGHMLGNDNFGIFLYSLLQVVACASVYAYSIKFLSDEKVPNVFLLIMLGIYTLVPIFPFYSICAFKDTYFALLFMLFIIRLYKLIKYDVTKKNVILLILNALFLCLIRHNGILILLLALPVSFVVLKDKRKQILTVLVVSLGLYFTYSSVIIPAFKITPTSAREVLSVPIQQISALIVHNEDVIEEKDKYLIDQIIDYDVVKEKYDPELSDPIKNTYNKDATKEELMKFFGVWFKYLCKKPITYIEATINNAYGYFYPDAQNWYFYYKKYKVLNDVGFDYHYNSLSLVRVILSGYGQIYPYIPIIGSLANIGLLCWIYIYICAYLVNNKQKEYIILLLPASALIFSCLIGPVNTYFRYVLPYSITLPMILLLIYKNRKNASLN